jgi:glycosyltransferase involved in cell wall biosynthesis
VLVASPAMPGVPLVLISGKDPVTQMGGHGSYVRAHALAAIRLGFEPHVFAVGRHSDISRAPYGIVHRIAAPPRGRLPVTLQIPLLARAALRYLEGRAGPHIVHGFAIWSASAALVVRGLARRGQSATAVASAYATRTYEIAAMQAGLGTYLSPAERLRYRAWLAWASLVDHRVEGWGYRHADAVVVNYRSVHRILTDAYGDGLAVRLMPYAAPASFEDTTHDSAPTRPRAASGEPPLILCVSRHDPRKGIDVLLRSLAGVAAAGIPFRAILVGPGRLLDAHRRLAADLGLSGAVSIPGPVPDVDPLLQRADVYVLPSRAEASGSVATLEALRRGVPVIASACDGIPEDLPDDSVAVLVPPGDVDALRHALTALLGDPERRAALAEAGRQLYEQRFTAARLTAALRDLYADSRVPTRRSPLQAPP